MVGSISDPDDKIVTDHGSKSTTENKTASWVVSDSDLLDEFVNKQLSRNSAHHYYKH